MIYQYFTARPLRTANTNYVFPRKKPAKFDTKGTSEGSTGFASPAARMLERLKPLMCVGRVQRQHNEEIEDDEKRLIPDPLTMSLRKKSKWYDRFAILQKRQGIVLPPSPTSAWNSSNPGRPNLKPLKLTLHSARASVAERYKRFTGTGSADSYAKLSDTTSDVSPKRNSSRKNIRGDDSDVDEQLWDKRERDSFYSVCEYDPSASVEKAQLHIAVPVEPLRLTKLTPAHLSTRVRFATPHIDDDGAPESIARPSTAPTDPETPVLPSSPYTRMNEEDLIGAWGPPPQSPKGMYSRAGVIRGRGSGDANGVDGFRPKWGMKYLKPSLPERMGGRDAPPNAFEIGEDDSDVEGLPPQKHY